MGPLNNSKCPIWVKVKYIYIILLRDQGSHSGQMACQGRRFNLRSWLLIIFKFDPVADVSTDKMFTQIPSTFNGKIHKRFHNE